MRFLIVLVLIPLTTFSQRYRNPVVDNGMVYEIPNRPAGLVGSAYLTDDWKLTRFYFKKGAMSKDTLENVLAKLDLKTNAFDVNSDKGVKTLEGSKVKAFEWFDPAGEETTAYLNCDNFTYDGSKLNGFCKVLSQGNSITLAERYTVDILKANYNVQMNVGSKDDRIVKKSELFLIKESQLIPIDKRTFYSHFYYLG